MRWVLLFPSALASAAPFSIQTPRSQSAQSLCMGWNLWCHLTRKSTGLPGRVIIVVTMRIRMKDIAADLGVSLMTVSKGLRNEPDIGEATRRRIQKRAKELNYLPNVNARSLVTGHSFLVGLIVPDLLHPFFADVARGLSMTLRRQGYFLIVTSSKERRSTSFWAGDSTHWSSHRFAQMAKPISALKPAELRTFLSIAGSLVTLAAALSAVTIRKLACSQPNI